MILADTVTTNDLKTVGLIFSAVVVMGAAFAAANAMLKFFDRFKAPRVSVETFQMMVLTQSENVKRLDKHDERLTVLDKEMARAVAATTILEKLLNTMEAKHGR